MESKATIPCPSCKGVSIRWLRAIPVKGGMKTFRCNKCGKIFEAKQTEPQKVGFMEFTCLECGAVSQAKMSKWETGDVECSKCKSQNVMSN